MYVYVCTYVHTSTLGLCGILSANPQTGWYNIPKAMTRSWYSRPSTSTFRQLDPLGSKRPTAAYMSKDPNRRYLPKTRVTIPNIAILDTPYLGILDP